MLICWLVVDNPRRGALRGHSPFTEEIGTIEKPWNAIDERLLKTRRELRSAWWVLLPIPTPVIGKKAEAAPDARYPHETLTDRKSVGAK